MADILINKPKAAENGDDPGYLFPELNCFTEKNLEISRNSKEKGKCLFRGK